MPRNPRTVTPATPLEDVVEILIEGKLGALPVIGQNLLVRIITDNSDSVSVDVCTVDNEVLTNWDIGGVAVFNACVTLTAGSNFNVQSTGEVTLRALSSVILTDGFSVETGGKLRVEIP